MAGKAQDKVLRIGIIQGGKIIEERLLRQREPITIGQSSKATFALPHANLPASLTLFEYKAGVYQLTFQESMDGRVTIDGNVLDFGALTSQGLAKRRGDGFEYPLSQNCRGKVVIGDLTVLFQFVTPPPKPARTKLPPSAQVSPLKRIDLAFAAALLFSLASHSGLFTAAHFSPVPERSALEGIPDRFAKLIVPDLPEKKPEKPEVEGKGPGEEKKEEVAKKEEKKPEAEKKEPSTAEEKAAAVARHKEEVREEVAKKGLLKILGAVGDTGIQLGDSPLADVFAEGGVDEDLDEAFAGIGGVEVATTDATQAARARKGEDGARKASIEDLRATTKTAKVDLGQKKETKVSGRIAESTPEVDGELSQAEISRVIKRRLSAIKTCYDRVLKRNPQLQGKVVIRFTINESGRVVDAFIESSTMNNKDVESCILARFKTFRFPRPSGGSVTVAYPMVLTPGG